MAKGKGKKVASSGPKKNHGPKKKMFHCWTSTMRMHLAKAGLLSKYNNYEDAKITFSGYNFTEVERVK
jgi:hypothetical protein